ncbi:unnamed protein product [Rotaria sordida]|uniref:F-box domain-containing protein n=1 Tax=Rotaria sordida TaxID=392033 RepID=A0A814VQJ8_9BILA|nr:unnamed protein product [Rotaria sordida]CAF1191171.1 unnamed protein product [Rotaria sordida]CAF3757659.1 unnamed protein product [Rotaria sordida]
MLLDSKSSGPMLSLELLPNELLHYIFSYLHSDEIIYSFLNLNIRFYMLCLPYIERLNLSTTTNVPLWNTQNFQLVPSLIKTLKLNDTQLEWVFDFPDSIPIYFTQLQAIQLRILLQNEHYKQYLPIFKETISSLVLDYQNATIFSQIDHEILNEFITNDTSTVLNTLIIDGVCLSIDSENFQICQTLKRLTLSVEYQHHLFILLEYLPQLEYLNIGIREGKAGKYDYNYSKTKTLQLKLRQLIISANDIDFYDLNLLLRQCQSTLEILKLRLKIDYIIDGRMLESWKRSLKQFYFYFFCHSLDGSSIDADDLLSSFQTSLWLHDQSVMFFTNSFYQTYTIVSPPYDCRNINCSLTNEFLNYQLNNRQVELKMPRIKRIFLNDKQESILEIGSNFHLIDNYDNNNNSWKEDAKLSTVHTLIIVNNQDHLNVKRLFKLLPNLYRLHIDYDLLVASLYDLYSIERQEKYQYQHLQEILIHFQPNQHIELDDDFKNRVKLVYGKAKILS